MIKVVFKQWECKLNIARYHNSRIALYLTDIHDGENVATCTVNLPEKHLDKDEVFIKEWSENEGMTNALMCAGVIESNYYQTPVGPYGSMASVCKLKNNVKIKIK